MCAAFYYMGEKNTGWKRIDIPSYFEIKIDERVSLKTTKWILSWKFNWHKTSFEICIIRWVMTLAVSPSRNSSQRNCVWKQA